MQILVKIAFILLPFLASTQISFYKRYADNSYDFGQGIVQLEDSSYVVTGTSGSFTGHAQSFLMQVDSLGNKLWSNHYGGPESEQGRRVLYQENFGFFMCGQSNSFSGGDYDFYLVKVDGSGVEEWSRTYGDSDWERLMDAVMTRDTGTVLVGEKENGLYGADMFIVRTDMNGDTLWTKTLTNMGDDIATSVDLYQDSILYVGGTIFHADSSQSKGIIYKMLDTGEMLDTLLFDTYAGEYELNDLHVIGDTVQALGSNRRDASDEWDYTFYRSDLTVNGFGNISCFNSNVGGNWYGDVFTSYGANAKRYMAMSFEGTPTTLPNGRDIHVQRGNTFMFYDGDVAFLNYDEPDVSGEFIRTNDGGAILVGYHQSLLVGSGGGTIYLLKIGADEAYPLVDNVLSTALVHLGEEFKVLEISVYPNPAGDWLRVELPSNEPANYQLTQLSGQQVLSGVIQNASTIDTSNLPSGVYLLEVATNEGRAVNRVVIQ
jgi:hypothetical protein